VDRIHRLIYRTRSEGRTRLLGIVLSQLEMNAEKTLCWARITSEMMRHAGAMPEDREGVVNYLLEIEGVQVACLAEERGENTTKFSLRSQPPVDVGNLVCKPLGGGGHAQAAGITLDLPLEEALKIVLRQAETVLK
jgi:phosphoesterase RecJ-like protein